MRINSPCKGCLDRCIGCHGTCDKFIEFKKKVDIQNKQISNAKLAYSMHTSHIMEQREKIRRHHG